MMQAPVFKDLVLVGGGHSHIEVLRRFGMKPIPGVRLTLVTRDVHTPYSGMVPGFVSGFYSYDDCHVDLARLSRFANARFIHAEARGINPKAQEVLLRDRPAIPYDLLSINVGITPAASTVPGAAQHTTGVKPIDRFVARFEKLLQRARHVEGPLRVVVVGGGAAGVELACALQHRFVQERQQHGRTGAITVSLVSRGPILPNLTAYARSVFLPLLKERGVQLHEVAGGVVEVMPSALHLGDGSQLGFDECLWCTQAGAASWVAEVGLPTDADGFLAVNEFLQCQGADGSGPTNVFAAGDIAAFAASPRPKAGVFAVRAGPPLAENLRRHLLGQPLVAFRPQATYLNLITAGDKYAVAVKGWLGTQGGWCWRLKDWIDRSFMAKYSTVLDFDKMMTNGVAQQAQAQLPAALGPEAVALAAAARMRCGGCGSKVGASVLARVLQRLQQQQQAGAGGTPAALAPSEREGGAGAGVAGEVLKGLGAPDDAAVIRPPPPGFVTVHTVDYFRSLLDDPYTFGMVAANHALGDCYAMGAEPRAAMAIAVVPFAPASKVEGDLHQMMAGAVRVLQEAGCQLVGGHSSEGAELALGFSVYGHVKEDQLLTKSGLQPGQALVLTKPLGTGTILAAHMRGGAKGRWVEAAVRTMVQSNAKAVSILRKHGATACTDVTGFGLLGHAAEMARASQVCIEMDPGAVPLIEGASECAASQHLSSLHVENSAVAACVVDAQQVTRHSLWPLLVDPQTGGGLLTGIPAAGVQACIQDLKGIGYDAHKIGYIVQACIGCNDLQCIRLGSFRN